MRICIKLINMIAFASAATIGTAVAQTQPDSTDLFDLSVEELLNVEVVSASQQAQKATEAPATIYVITEQQIAERGYSYLDELLEDVPEIEIQRKSAPEYSNYYSVRGIAGNEKFLVLLDGIRVNAVDGTPHVVGVNYPLANLKQVEIILGPASALYGVDGFSGIINMITKKGSEINGVSVSGRYGSFNTVENAVTVGYGKKDISFTLTGNVYHSDEPVLPTYYKDEFSWYTNEYSRNGNIRLTPFAPNVIIPLQPKPYASPTDAYAISGGLTFKDFEIGFYANSESHLSSTSVYPDYSIYQRDAIFKINQQTIFGKHNYQSENGKLAVQSYLALSSFEIDPESKFVNTYSSYRDAYKYAFNRGLIVREQVTYQVNENSSFIGGVNIQGFAALAKTSDLPVPFRRNVPVDLQDLYYIGTNTTDMNGNDLTIYQDFYYVNENNIGAFAQYQGKVGRLLNLTLGLRYDHNSRYGSSINPRAGLVVTPSNAFKIKVLYGEAFLAPSIYKSYQHYGGLLTVDNQGNPTGDPAQTVGLFGPFLHLTNTNLAPEKLRTYEVGASYIKGNVGLSADLYYNYISDLITNSLQFNQQFKGVQAAAVERPINAGTATTYGFTTKLDYHAQFGSVKVQSYAAYSYSDGDIDGQPIAYSAQHTVKAGVLVKAGKFSIDPRLIYRSASSHGILTDANGKALQNDAFALVNLFARYQVRKNFEVNLKVRNLLDARYHHVSYGGPEAFPATPQDPISIAAGVVLKVGQSN